MADEIDDDERERLKRQKFIAHLRERESRVPRCHVSEHEMRERRLQDRDRQTAERDLADKEQRESERVAEWLVQRQCEEDIQRSVASEPALVEEFNWQWVQRFVAARLRDEREYFERRFEEMNSALVDNARAVGDALDAIDRALSNAAQKGTNELTGALERITKQLNENQHAIMRAINNRTGEPSKSTIEEPPQGARHDVH
jgi:hypothetical protein